MGQFYLSKNDQASRTRSPAPTLPERKSESNDIIIPFLYETDQRELLLFQIDARHARLAACDIPGNFQNRSEH